MQREIKSTTSKKKKKKKKRRGPTGGDAMDDNGSEYISHVDQASEYQTRDLLMNKFEEEKVPNISKTRIGDIDQGSIQNSHYDMGSLENEPE